MRWLLILTTVFVGVHHLHAATKRLVTLTDVEFVDTAFADGDSFMVRAQGTSHVFRLYYVDCPEITLSTDNDRRRLLEQARYFGIDPAKNIVPFGVTAKKRVAGLLRNNAFTVHTVFANARGRSGKSRYYAFVTLADGSDLAARLVAEGLARPKGVARATPDGLHSEDQQALLDDLELFAALSRRGIWANSDPRKIVAMRKQQREENKLLNGLSLGVQSPVTEDNPININQAPMEELQQIKGIGPVLAGRIVAARPFSTMEDLLRVEGIGEGLLREARPYLALE